MSAATGTIREPITGRLRLSRFAPEIQQHVFAGTLNKQQTASFMGDNVRDPGAMLANLAQSAPLLALACEDSPSQIENI